MKRRGWVRAGNGMARRWVHADTRIMLEFVAVEGFWRWWGTVGDTRLAGERVGDSLTEAQDRVELLAYGHVRS